MKSLLAAAPLALLVLPPLARYADGPPAGHTGGFGEPTCARCHLGQPTDPAAGTLSLEGVPAIYRPGESYLLRVLLTRPGVQRGGFQLSARLVDGAQAGELAGKGEGTRLIHGDDGVHFASHSRLGTEPTAPDTVRWTVRWTAPRDGGTVVLNLAGNAADGDDSALGDRILVRADTVRATGGG